MLKDKGKVISISSVKGGTGKTAMTINLAGIYYMMRKKVLIIDGDFYSGGISAWLGVPNKRDVFQLVDAISNNRFSKISDYVTSYNNGIDVLASPRDPRSAIKIDSKYIPIILDFARREYDVILVDTNHIMNEVNLMILDHSYMSLFLITNDLVCLKNMKSMVSIFKDTGKRNYLVCLNKSIDIGKDYFSLFDIRNVIKNNIDYTVSDSFYIKNIDKYILDGEILTLNKKIVRFHSKDINHIKSIAEELISDKYKDMEGDNNG